MSDGGEDAGAFTTHFTRVVAAVFSCTVCTVAHQHHHQQLPQLLQHLLYRHIVLASMSVKTYINKTKNIC